MNRKTYRLPSPRPLCGKCRTQLYKLCAPTGRSQTQLQVVSAMYDYLMTSWNELPDRNKQALGFDFVVGSDGEEAELNHMARLFIEYAEVSFGRALVARRRRLGMTEGGVL